jgi:FMN-dependent NADH-azoreductase
MKLTLKQKIKEIETWFDQLRADEKIEQSEKELITVSVGKSKVFLDKNKKTNDKIQLDYIVIKRSEIPMLDSKIVESIYKLSLISRAKD